MERLILKKLLNWKNSPYRKPLILKGVRLCIAFSGNRTDASHPHRSDNRHDSKKGNLPLKRKTEPGRSCTDKRSSC